MERIPVTTEALPKTMLPLGQPGSAWSTTDLLTYQRIARNAAKKWGYRDLAEDFAQEAACEALAGRSTRIDWMLIDFLREEFGSTRSISGRLRVLARSRQLSLDAPLAPGSDERTLHDLIRAPPGGDPPAIGRDWRARGSFTGQSAVIADLVFDAEMPQREVAAIFGVTETRISQMIWAKILPEIRRAAVIEETWAIYNDDPDASKLLVRWIAI